METVISKEEVQELIKLEGEARGVPFKTQADFILRKEGKGGLEKLEETMAKLGHPLKYGEIKSMASFPLGLLAVNMLVIKRLFNYSDKHFQKMGSIEAKSSSLIIRIFMKYFISLERMAKEVPKMWRNHYSTGDLKVMEINKKERYVILRLEDFKCHHLFCQDLVGYFPSILEMVLGADANCEETKCVHRGDQFHQYLIKW